MITLITGGVKSGKSSFALKLSENFKKKAFIATGVAFDEEMKKRIEKHKQERIGFDTFEEPVEIYKIIESLNQKYEVAILDCLTTYLGNLFYYEKDIEYYTKKLIDSLQRVNYNLIIVTNEVGWGIIPENSLSRKYVDSLGLLNKKVASISDNVYLMVSGIGVKIK